MQIAQYKTRSGSIIVLEVNRYNEDSGSNVVRVSEIVEVEFPPRPVAETEIRELLMLCEAERHTSRALSDIQTRISQLSPKDGAAA